MSRRRHVFALAVLGAVLLGCALRLAHPGDMEYKSDERFLFERALHVGVTEPWPWLGLRSGVHIRNPGLSVWVFVGLGRIVTAISGQTLTPLRLALGVMTLNCLALWVLWGFAISRTRRAERAIWLWATALVAVNPFAVLYQRKIWAQSILPLFSLVFLLLWWKRTRPLPAFGWGLLGICLGQIHLSGFFLAAGFALVTFIHERRHPTLARAHWRAWIIGTGLGALPMSPWLCHLAEHLRGLDVDPLPSAVFGLEYLMRLGYAVYWFTDPLGLHLGGILGLHLGNGFWAQLRDFLPYPLFIGHATWLMGATHAGLAGVCVILLVWLGRTRFWNRQKRHSPASSTQLAVQAAFWGCGGLMTLTTVLIRRYYLLITFPLESVWLARLILQKLTFRSARVLLLTIFVLELAVTLGVLDYVHRNGGAPSGDYGTAFDRQRH